MARMSVWLGALAFGVAGCGSGRTLAPDLGGINGGRGWSVVNRAAQVFDSGGRTIVALDERSGSGAVWLNDVQVGNATIEVELRGKDVLQRSFVGVAFRVENDSTYDVVYFRAFNFRAADSARHAHAVQYSSHPGFGWPRLRSEYPGQYEESVEPAPDPNGWFHARIEIEKPVVRVFVNRGPVPVLTVKELTARTGGRVGLWVGEGSGGSFANLRLTQKK